jgi:PPP family 3-phenylpropionic acid transporter
VQKYERRPLRHLGRDSGLVALLVATCLVGIAEGVYMTFSGVYMDHLGGAQVLVGGLFGLSAFAELPTMQFSGAISRKLGKPLTLIIAYGFMGLAFFGYGLVGIPSVMLLFGVAKGIGYGLYFAGTVSLIDERAPEVWSATVQSLMTATAWGLAPLLTVPLGGWIADVLGLPAVFICAGVAEALALVILAGALIGGKFDETPLIEASDA